MHTLKRKYLYSIFVPLSTESHPYLKLLYSELKKLGLTVYSLDMKRRNIVINFLHLMKSNIIHLHWIEYYVRKKNRLLSFFALIAYILLLVSLKYLLRKKIIITLHNVIPHELQYYEIDYVNFLLSLQLASAIIVHNKYSKKKTAALYYIDPQKIHIVPHGHFIGYYPNVVTREEARKRLKISDNKIVITFFGNIREYKGINLLSRIIGDITNKHDVLFLICGKVHSKKLLKKLFKIRMLYRDNVKIIPQYIPDDFIQVVLNATDIGILPFSKIWTSGTLLLFLSFGIPVIVPHLEPIVELLGDKGIYYKPNDAESLSCAIEYAINNLDKLKKMREELREMIKKYDWKMIAKETLRIYLSAD